MILLIDTSTPTCRLTLIEGDLRCDYEWLAARTLAKDLLAYLRDRLSENSKNWSNITAIGVYEGPGSFTGLRIGITVMNTIADAQNVPIVVGRGDNWQQEVLEKLQSGQNNRIVLPFYGSEAHITVAKK